MCIEIARRAFGKLMPVDHRPARSQHASLPHTSARAFYTGTREKTIKIKKRQLEEKIVYDRFARDPNFERENLKSDVLSVLK